MKSLTTLSHSFFAIFFFALLLNYPNASLAQIDSYTPKTQTGLAPRTANEQQTIDAYRQSNQSVVHINTRQASYDVYFRVGYKQGMGSGVIIDSTNGLVLTNYHVIEGSDRISVTLSDGRTFPAIRVGFDKDNDVALLEISDRPKNLVAANLGDSDILEVGQRVMAIGNPFGLDRTLTTGVISSVDRTLEISKGQMMDDLIQTDAAINQGNSGGPLLDALGRVIGLNTFILSKTGESAGIGFAIPINQIKQAIPQLIKYGRILRPKLGLSLKETQWGLLVLFTQADGPAFKAGIKGALRRVKRGNEVKTYVDPSQADYIVRINGVNVKTKNEASEVMSKAPLNSEIEIIIQRGLRRKNLVSFKVKPVLD